MVRTGDEESPWGGRPGGLTAQGRQAPGVLHAVRQRSCAPWGGEGAGGKGFSRPDKLLGFAQKAYDGLAV